MSQPPPPPPRRRASGWLGFLLVALLAGFVVYVIRASGRSMLDMSEDDLMRLLFLIVILTFVGAGLLGRAMRPGEIVRAILGWGLVFLVAVGVYAYRIELAGVGGRLLGALAPGIPLSGELAGTGDDSVVIVRSLDGHFAVRATVDGQPMLFMVDTGASFVTLTPSDARKTGIDPDRLDYVTPIRTANGMINAAAIVLDRIVVGPIARTNVKALVAPGDALDQSLLGMSFLDTLTAYGISGDRMIMTP
jgi:aspartyl protease family protein